MKITKQEIQIILAEELSVALDEQSIVSRVASYLKSLAGPRQDDEKEDDEEADGARGGNQQQSAPSAAQPPPVDKPEQKKSYQTISLKQLADELMDNLPASAKAQERSKFSKLINKLKKAHPDGIKVGDYESAFAKWKSLNSQIKSLEGNMPVSKKKLISFINQANRIPRVDPQILNYLFGFLKDKDDFTLIEALLTKVIAEHLKGNRVVL